MLERLFKELSGQRVVYEKIPYSIDLTKWLVDNAPEDLREIANLIDGLMGSRA